MSGTPLARRIPRWRAPLKDGIAHAFLLRRGPAMCGAPNQEERFDHGKRSKCPTCVAKLAEVTPA